MKVHFIALFLLLFGCATQRTADESKTAPSIKVQLVDTLFDALKKNYAPLSKNPFTGKIVVLTDEQTMSAPEFAAATLLDNGRAKTFGAKTSGAGGDPRCFLADIEPGRPSELFQIEQDPKLSALMKESGIEKICVTATVGLRVNANGDIIGPFENFGVPVSEPYAVTNDDRVNGDTGYKKALLNYLHRLD